MKLGIYTGGSFAKWFKKLDYSANRKVRIELEKIKNGNLQMCKPLSNGIYEVKMRSGHRIYYGNDGKNQIRLLLAGSMKDDQSRMIKKAEKYWKQYKREQKISENKLVATLKL